jgi:hypothetical protein
MITNHLKKTKIVLKQIRMKSKLSKTKQMQDKTRQHLVRQTHRVRLVEDFLKDILEKERETKKLEMRNLM